MFWQWRKSASIQFILVSHKKTGNTLFNQKWDLERICEKRKCNPRRLDFVNIWTLSVMHGEWWCQPFYKIQEKSLNWGHSRGCCIDGQGSWSFSCYLVQRLSLENKDLLLKKETFAGRTNIIAGSLGKVSVCIFIG